MSIAGAPMPGRCDCAETKRCRYRSGPCAATTTAARFVERFEALTGFRVHSTSLEGLPREFLARPVPAPDLLVEQYGYELEPRTHNALCKRD